MTTTKLDELDHGYAWIILGGKNIIQNNTRQLQN